MGQKVMGLMSGTSLDGVDAALLDTDGRAFARPGPALTIPYDAGQRALLRAALDMAPGVAPDEPVPAGIAAAERMLTDVHARAVARLLERAGLTPADVALIGFHGQTILHRPDQHRTWQIGDGARLARMTGIAVVNDFRSADVAAGGQGAPLMPLYHAVLVNQLPEAEGHGASVVVNIGGVAQVTFVAPGVLDDRIIAFDTGPGNAPIDDWMQHVCGRPVDENGALAARGQVNAAALETMLAHPFFAQAPPKSLDRQDFGMAAVKDLSPADGAATLTAFTAAALAAARRHFPVPAARWIICGGGRHNATLMAMMRAYLDAPVLRAEDVGWDGDGLEAQGFAYLALRAKLGLPLSLPATTGVARPMTGGRYNASR